MSVGFAYGAVAPPPTKLPCTTNCGPSGHPSNECVVDSDCPHSDPCLVGNCHSGHCHHVPLCYDYNDCTVDTCDAGNCAFTPDNTLSCDDGVACTVNDGCSNGNCAGTPIDSLCDDGNDCTDDSCNASIGCVFQNDDTNTCTDNLSCTVAETCAGGICTSIPVICTDYDFCTIDPRCIQGDLCFQTYPPRICPPATPFCVSNTDTFDESDGACVECRVKEDCSGVLVCSTDGACVECIDVVNCPGSMVCDATGTCVDCLSDSDCAFPTPACFANLCRQCNNNADCDFDPCVHRECSVTQHTCVADPPIPGCCNVDADCDDGLTCTVDTCDVLTNSCDFVAGDADGDTVNDCDDVCPLPGFAGCPSNPSRPGCACTCCDVADPTCCDPNDPDPLCACP